MGYFRRFLGKKGPNIDVMRANGDIGGLTAALNSENKQLRYQAALALAHLGNSKSVPILIDALVDPQMDQQANKALMELGDAAVGPLKELIHTSLDQVAYMTDTLRMLQEIDSDTKALAQLYDKGKGIKSVDYETLNNQIKKAMAICLAASGMLGRLGVLAADELTAAISHNEIAVSETATQALRYMTEQFHIAIGQTTRTEKEQVEAVPVTSPPSAEKEQELDISWEGIYKAELLRFLTSARTKDYERNNPNTWWTEDDLALVLVKSNLHVDVGGTERMLPILRDAIAALIREKRIRDNGKWGSDCGFRAM